MCGSGLALPTTALHGLVSGVLPGLSWVVDGVVVAKQPKSDLFFIHILPTKGRKKLWPDYKFHVCQLSTQE